MIEADAGELTKCNGQDREVDAGHAEAEGEEADDHAACDRDQDRDRHADPRPDAEMHVERRGRVGAKPDIERMAERQLAGKAHHHVPGDTGVGEIKNDDQHGEQIIVGEGRCGDQGCEHQAQQNERLARHVGKEPGDHEVFLPMMPCGRNSSTSTRMANENMLLADGEKNSPASASVSPISTPPSGARVSEPSPPVITTMKASSVSAGPSGGVTSTISTMMAPAAPTQAAPSPNDSA